MATGRQIKKYRTERGWTLDELSEKSGVERGTIFALESRDSEKSSFFGQIAAAFGMTVDQLQDSEKNWLDLPNEDDLEQSRAGYVSFDLLDVRAAAGDGCEAVDFPEVMQRVNVLESWARQAIGGDLSRIKLISARGISMSGTIENGDVLFIDSTVQAYDGDGIYVIVRGRHVFVKRLEMLHGNRLAVKSDNAKSGSEELDAQQASEVVICGRVLAAWNLRRFW